MINHPPPYGWFKKLHIIVLMWVKQKKIINHPPVIAIFIGGIKLPFPVMGGLWHCLTHIIKVSRIPELNIILI
jgi:hypothetical protein